MCDMNICPYLVLQILLFIHISLLPIPLCSSTRTPDTLLRNAPPRAMESTVLHGSPRYLCSAKVGGIPKGQLVIRFSY